jgi:hypothetical protein
VGIGVYPPNVRGTRTLGTDPRLFEENGVGVCHEIHLGEDLYDGTLLEMLLDRVGGLAPRSPCAELLMQHSRLITAQRLR